MRKNWMSVRNILKKTCKKRRKHTFSNAGLPLGKLSSRTHCLKLSQKIGQPSLIPYCWAHAFRSRSPVAGVIRSTIPFGQATLAGIWKTIEDNIIAVLSSGIEICGLGRYSTPIFPLSGMHKTMPSRNMCKVVKWNYPILTCMLYQCHADLHCIVYLFIFINVLSLSKGSENEMERIRL